MPERNNNITYEIIEHIGTISSWESGWNRELNLISWNGANPKYDIREWDDNHERMSKGITLHPWEMRNLVDLYLTNNSEKAVEKGREKEAQRQKRRTEYRRTGSENDGRPEESKAASGAAPLQTQDSAAEQAERNTFEEDAQLQMGSSPAAPPQTACEAEAADNADLAAAPETEDVIDAARTESEKQADF